MEKLSEASSLSQKKKSEKNKETMIPDTVEESLHNWKLPPFPASDVYKRSGIFNYCPIKTVEEEIPLSEGYSTFPLFSDDLRSTCPKKFVALHVGMIQVGLKPTKLASNASAMICVRDKSLKFGKSVLGMVESKLCDGPVYFSYFPRSKSHFVSLSDELSGTLCIDVKTTQGPSILMYRMHYRVVKRQRDVRTRTSNRYCVDQTRKTTLFLTSLAQRNGVSSKNICWDEVAVPAGWVDWKETAEARVLTVDVPGRLISKKEIKVEVEDGSILQISGERKLTSPFAGLVVVHVGADCKFRSRFRLPENVKSEQMKVAMHNGVVTVTVPKETVSKKAEVKVIDISGN